MILNSEYFDPSRAHTHRLTHTRADLLGSSLGHLFFRVRVSVSPIQGIVWVQVQLSGPFWNQPEVSGGSGSGSVCGAQSHLMDIVVLQCSWVEACYEQLDSDLTATAPAQLPSKHWSLCCSLKVLTRTGFAQAPYEI